MGRDREMRIQALLARAKASGKRAFGFASTAWANCAEVPKAGVPGNWDFMCVEGDREWTRLEAEDGDEEA